MVLLGKAWSLNLAILEKACFPSGLPGAALAQLAAIVSPANKPTQIEMHLQAQIERWAKTWLSYSVFEKCLSAITFFFKKSALPILFCHKSEPSKQYMRFRIIWKNATIATLATNQELNITMLTLGIYSDYKRAGFPDYILYNVSYIIHWRYGFFGGFRWNTVNQSLLRTRCNIHDHMYEIYTNLSKRIRQIQKEYSIWNDMIW